MSLIISVSQQRLEEFRRAIQIQRRDWDKKNTFMRHMSSPQICISLNKDTPIRPILSDPFRDVLTVYREDSSKLQWKWPDAHLINFEVIEDNVPLVSKELKELYAYKLTNIYNGADYYCVLFKQPIKYYTPDPIKINGELVIAPNYNQVDVYGYILMSRHATVVG